MNPIAAARILGVSDDFSLDELKSAYRRLARRWHPDANRGSAEAARNFRIARQAYDALLPRICSESESGQVNASSRALDDAIAEFVDAEARKRKRG